MHSKMFILDAFIDMTFRECIFFFLSGILLYLIFKFFFFIVAVTLHSTWDISCQCVRDVNFYIWQKYSFHFQLMMIHTLRWIDPFLLLFERRKNKQNIKFSRDLSQSCFIIHGIVVKSVILILNSLYRCKKPIRNRNEMVASIAAIHQKERLKIANKSKNKQNTKNGIIFIDVILMEHECKCQCCIFSVFLFVLLHSMTWKINSSSAIFPSSKSHTFFNIQPTDMNTRLSFIWYFRFGIYTLFHLIKADACFGGNWDKKKKRQWRADQSLNKSDKKPLWMPDIRWMEYEVKDWVKGKLRPEKKKNDTKIKIIHFLCELFFFLVGSSILLVWHHLNSCCQLLNKWQLSSV